MRLDHDQKEARPYLCLECDHEFYWAESEEPSVCPDCGAKDGAVVPTQSLEDEDYARPS